MKIQLKEVIRPENKKSYKWLWITLGIIMVLLIIFVPTKQVAYTVEVPTTGQYRCEGQALNTDSVLRFEIGEKRKFEGWNKMYYELDYTVYNQVEDNVKYSVIAAICNSDEYHLPYIKFDQPTPGEIYELNGYSTERRLLRSADEYSSYSGVAIRTYPALYNCKISPNRIDRCYTPKETRTETRYKTVNWLFG